MMETEATGMTFQITSAMLEPLQTTINSGITELVPIGLAIFGVLAVVGMVPRILYKFM